MIPYVLSTIISTALSYIDYLTDFRFMKVRVFNLLSILVLCLLAGYRDESVGTDTAIYGESLFTWIHNNSLADVIAMNSIISIELGYILLVYLVSRFTDNVFWDYFMMEFVCTFFTYRALDNNKIKKYKWLGVFLYNTLFYSFSLNLMRQTMAMAIVLFAINYMFEDKIKMYFLTVMLAFLVHRTAVLGIPIYLMFVMTGMGKDSLFNINSLFKRYRIVSSLIICVCSVGVVFLAKYIIRIFVAFKPSYEQQLLGIGSYNPSIAFLLLMLAIVLPLVFVRILNGNKEKYDFHLLMLFVATIVWQLQGVATELFRVSMYFWMIVLISIPKFISDIKNLYLKYGLILYYIPLTSFYYWFVFVYRMTNETYPYTSVILGLY